MTISEAKAKLIAWCNAQVGYAEGANNWNKYAPKWTEAGGWNAQNQPWCDVFVDVGFIETFGIALASKLTYQPIGGFSALCSASANFYRQNGAWYTSPEVGDQVFFNVNGGINHTGIVVGVSGGIVTTVEGNSSDIVRKNSYGQGSTYISGYGRPNWSIFSDQSADDPPASDPTPAPEPTPAKPTCSVTITLPELQFGDEGFHVKLMQTALIAKGFSCGWYGADGDFGQQTKIGLFEFQKANSLDTDCVCGKESWSKLIGE